jgi:hypothetical protein
MRTVRVKYKKLRPAGDTAHDNRREAWSTIDAWTADMTEKPRPRRYYEPVRTR